MIKGILYEQFIGVKFNHNLAFDQIVKSFCENAEVKLKALVSIFLNFVLVKKNLLMNSFFTTQYSHFLLMWVIDVMGHNRF